MKFINFYDYGYWGSYKLFGIEIVGPFGRRLLSIKLTSSVFQICGAKDERKLIQKNAYRRLQDPSTLNDLINSIHRASSNNDWDLQIRVDTNNYIL